MAEVETEVTPTAETTIAPAPEAKLSFANASKTTFSTQPVIPEVKVAPVTPPVETSTTVVTQEGEITPPIEENTSSFSFPEIKTEAAPAASEQGAPAQTTLSWKNAIKQANIDEVLKEAGLDDFDIEMFKHRKNGGNAYDYLAAKSVDYNKISDEEVLKTDIAKKYPHLTADEHNYLFNKKYGIGELDEDDIKQEKGINKKADAYTLRQSLIAEQQKFKIAEPVPNSQPNNAQEQQKQIELQKQQREAEMQFYNNHEATKNLMTSKRVAIDLGDAGKFNFKIDKPEFLLQAMTDGTTISKLMSNEKGEPDIQALQEMTLFALNRKQFVQDILNYGKSLGVKSLVDEGQNAKRPNGQTPTVTTDSPKAAWSRAAAGKFGS